MKGGCEFNECLEVLAKGEDMWRPGWVILVIGIIVTAIYFITTYFVIQKDNVAGHEDEDKGTAWFDAIGIYFGVIVNLMLILYAFLMYRSMAKGLHVAVPDYAYTSPWFFSVAFIISSLILMGSIIYKKKHVDKDKIPAGWIVGITFAIIIIGALLGAGIYGLIRYKREVSKEMYEAVRTADMELTQLRHETLSRHGDDIKAQAKAAALAKAQALEAQKKGKAAAAAKKELEGAGTSRSKFLRSYLQSREKGDTGIAAEIEKSRSRSREKSAAKTSSPTPTFDLTGQQLAPVLQAIGQLSRSRKK
jgi:hypothetical protein